MADGGEGERPERPWIGTYVLNGHEPVPEYDSLAWGRWMEEHDRHVRSTWLGAWRVSTVFLGLDHGHGMGGPPILFETMVFKGDPRRRRRIMRYTSEQVRAFQARARQRGPFVFSRRLHWSEGCEFQRRYATWTAAELGHMDRLRVVQKVRAHVLPQTAIDDWEYE